MDGEKWTWIIGFLSKWQFTIYLFVSLDTCHVDDDERPPDPICPGYLPGKCTEDKASSEQHFVLPNDCQYNESSDAEWESYSVTNNTTLENLLCDETAEGTFNFNPGQVNER